jgi:hypothetical protein
MEDSVHDTEIMAHISSFLLRIKSSTILDTHANRERERDKARNTEREREMKNGFSPVLTSYQMVNEHESCTIR